MRNADDKGMDYEGLVKRAFKLQGRSYKFGADADIFDSENKEGYRYIIGTHIKNAVYQLLDDDSINNDARERLNDIFVDISECKSRADFIDIVTEIKGII